jgi:SAM-dependent methyltransferase
LNKGAKPMLLVTEAQLAGLPAPVQRYLRFARVLGQPVPAAIQRRQRGTMRLKAVGRSFPFDAVQSYTTNPPGFVWQVKARDSFVNGHGRMQVWPAPRIKVVDARGSELDQGELLRFLGELPWYPAVAVLPYLHWESVGDAAARVTMTVGALHASAVFELGPDGAITQITAQRYWTGGKGSAQLLPWSGTHSAYRDIGGLRLPTACEVSWLFRPRHDLPNTYLQFGLSRNAVSPLAPSAVPGCLVVGATVAGVKHVGAPAIAQDLAGAALRPRGGYTGRWPDQSSLRREDAAVSDQLREMLTLDHYPRAAGYDPAWMIENQMGPNALWLAESLSTVMSLEPGSRVLDLGCGRGMTSIFLAREFGVQVWAADLWIQPTPNWERVQRAGVETAVFPIYAEAHMLPFAEGFFDAIVSVDAYHYFGSADLYAAYIARFLRPGGRIGVVVPGLLEEVETLPPPHLAEYWEDDFCTFHSPAWWRRHWQHSGALDVEHADSVPRGWEDWLTWNRACLLAGTGYEPELRMLEADGGRTLGFTRIVATKRSTGG